MTTLSSPAEPWPVRLLGQWRALFVLAWPVVLSRAGILVMVLVSTVIVGRSGTFELARFSLGAAVFFPLLVTGVGCMVGIIATAAREKGAGNPELPAIALRGLRWAALVGGIASLLIYGSEGLLRVIGQEPALAAGAGHVARILAPGALFQILYVAASFYLEGTGRMKPALVAMILANIVNAAFTLILVDGRLGLPALGADGAAIGMTLARFAMAAGLVVWMLRLPEFAPWRGHALHFWGPGGWQAGAEMRRIGLAGGAAYFFETMAFATLAQAAGLLGTVALASYTIVQNVEATVFMIALGLSVATAVRVGQAAGAHDPGGARLAGLAGISAAMLLIGAIGAGLVWVAQPIVGFYSEDPALIARAAPLFAILAVSMIFDAGQVVLGQSTRALGDSWGTTLCFFAAFWGVMIPAGLLLAFRTPLAEAGLFIGTGLGCATAVLLLSLRFRLLVRRVR